MQLHSRHLQIGQPGKVSGARRMIECAQCGERLFTPEWSEHVDERRVRHLWTCDGCGYAFETTVRVAAA